MRKIKSLMLTLLFSVFVISWSNNSFSQIASDDASDSPYADGWASGDNGGYGFDAWTVNGTGTGSGGVFRATNSNPQCQVLTDGYAFGLWANNNYTMQAIRPLTTTLTNNQLITFDWNNSTVANPGSVGFSLTNSSNEVLFEYYFIGGLTNYYVNDNSGENVTTIGHTTSKQSVSFKLTNASTGTFQLTVTIGGTPTSLSGTLKSPTGGKIIKNVRFFNYKNPYHADNSEYNSYYNNLKVYTYTSIAAGDWDTPTTWFPNGVPGDGDVVIIDTYSITANSANCASISLVNFGALVLSGTLAVSGNVVVSSFCEIVLSGSSAQLNVTGDITTNGIINTGDNTISCNNLTNNADVLLNAGTITVSSNLVNEGNINVTANGNINVTGNIDNNSTGVINISNGTITAHILTNTGSITNENGICGSITTTTFNNTGGTVDLVGTTVVAAPVGGTIVVATTWNGLTWDNGAPSATDNAIISGAYTIVSNTKWRKLFINSNGSLTIDNGDTLTITHLQLKADATGCGSLITNGNLNFTGVANIERFVQSTSTPTAYNNYSYITSPVEIGATASIFGVDGNTMGDNRMYEWTEATATWAKFVDPSYTLQPLTGYLYKCFGASNSAGLTKTYTGTPNTGLLSIPISRAYDTKGFNLVGNPYPSALDFKALYDDNGATNKMMSSYWMRNFAGTSVWYNATGNVSSAPEITRYIQPMTAFFVRVLVGETTGTFKVDNAFRLHSTSGLDNKKESASNVLRLSVSRNEYTDIAVVGFFDNANTTLEEYDTEKMFDSNPEIPQIWTVTSDDKYVVLNGLPKLNTQEVTIPLGFKTDVAGTFTFTLTNLPVFDTNTAIYVADSYTGTFTDLRLTNGVFTFTSEVYNNTERFTLHFGLSNPTEVNSPATESVKIYSSGEIVYINTNASNYQVEIYDIYGRKVISETTKSNCSSFVINTQGAYLVKVISNGKVETKRVLIQK